MRVLIALISIFILCCAEKSLPEQSPELYISVPFSYFPPQYTCDGEDLSPPIEIRGVAENAKSLVMIVDDPDAPFGVFTHWLIWNIPPTTTLIPEGIPKESVVEKPVKAIQGKNDFGKTGYNGPCPPSGVHRYRFKLYVLDTELDLKPNASKTELENAMKGHILQFAIFEASYGRTK
ncbi:MAG: YbhB/YbcL family Raf kinase inhibitor-like protein [Archaeoglobaceae archaeon]|nr:YbhB/YbcL family Raf kinase inhibitor-like protein [Archaeoglobales archaeon]